MGRGQIITHNYNMSTLINPVKSFEEPFVNKEFSRRLLKFFLVFVLSLLGLQHGVLYYENPEGRNYERRFHKFSTCGKPMVDGSGSPHTF